MSTQAASNGVPWVDIDAERSILAAMLLGTEAIVRAAGLTDSSIFYRTAHQKIFNAIVGLNARSERADSITVTDELRKRGDLEVVGGPAALAHILEYATTTANLEEHIKIAARHARNRRARHVVLEAIQDIDGNPDRAAEALLARRDRIDDLAANSCATSIEFLDLAAIGEQGTPAVPWLVPGWVAAGDIVLASGDGGIGKSTTIGALAMAVAGGTTWCGVPVLRPGRVLVFDEEQSTREVARLYLRLGAPCAQLHVASQQGVNLTTSAGLGRLEAALREHRPLLVVLDSVQQVFTGVDGNDAAAVAKVYSDLFRLRRDHGCAFVLIGHLRKPPSDGHASKLHLVHGSIAFGTQASTVWVATSPARNLMDLTQVKRRDGERTSLRIRYTSGGSDGAITLIGEGAIEEGETMTERAEDFVLGYLRAHEVSPAKWIVAAGGAEVPPLPQRSVERALARLANTLRSIEKPRRGYYAIAARPDTAPREDA